MDFFQRSSPPPNFISFCLENQDQTNIVTIIPAGSVQALVLTCVHDPTPNAVPSPPHFPPMRAPSRTVNSLTTPIDPLAEPQDRPIGDQILIVQNLVQSTAVDSPSNADSNIDVTTYADEMVERLQGSKLSNLGIS